MPCTYRHRESLDRDDQQSCDWADFSSALLAGGDSRLAIDPATGLNKYLCPPRPAPEIACLSSCTASPISPSGYAAALACHRDVCDVSSQTMRAERLAFWRARVEIELLAYFGAHALADVVLAASGTDAVLLTATMLSLEDARRPIAVVLPSAAETGSGVPRAATCRGFDDDLSQGVPAIDGAIGAVEVPLREANGEPHSDDALCDAFAAAARAAPGRPVLYLTHGTKTGLVAPSRPPSGVEVVVDACQVRIAPAAVCGYLERGWPVIVTGSKFLGGPAFSGAVLLPRGRFRGVREQAQQRCAHVAPGTGGPCGHGLAGLGPVLRWIAALDGLSSLAKLGPAVPRVLARLAAEAELALSGIRGVTCLAAPASTPSFAGEWPAGIVPLAVRDPTDPARWLAANELRLLYGELARRGVLVGQPVSLGRHGALRVAIGARDVVAGTIGPALERLVEELPALIRRREAVAAHV